jgi:hypothetical protein
MIFMYDFVIRLRFGNGMNLFIYYTSNLWHSLRGMQDHFIGRLGLCSELTIDHGSHSSTASNALGMTRK